MKTKRGLVRMPNIWVFTKKNERQVLAFFRLNEKQVTRKVNGVVIANTPRFVYEIKPIGE